MSFAGLVAGSSLLGVVGCGDFAEKDDLPRQVAQGLTEEISGRRAELDRILEEDPGNKSAWEELEALDQQADEDFGILLEMRAIDGHEVRFFEPSPGSILVLHKYTENETVDGPSPAAKDAASLEEIWANVAGSAPMPTVLSEALARRIRWVDEAEFQALVASSQSPEVRTGADPAPGTPEQREHLGPTGGSNELVPKHVTSSASHFINDQNGCGLTSSPRPAQWCWTNVTGRWGVVGSGMTGQSSALAMYDGIVMTWKTRYEGSTHRTVVLPGNFWYWQGISGSTCVLPGVCWMHEDEWEMELENAGTGVDEWHWGGSFSDAGWPGPLLPTYHPEL